MILVLGGIYLAFAGAEKIVEYFFHRAKKGHQVVEEAKENQGDAEKQKIKSAITTDFILSVEIVIIALGTVLEESLMIQIITVSIVSLLATVGVYGLVALIVRMDDIGFKLIKRSPNKGFFFKLGHLLVKMLPLVIKFFGFVGTIALLLVAGGIFEHNVPFLHHVLESLPTIVTEFALGLAVGMVAVGIVTVAKKLLRPRS